MAKNILYQYRKRLQIRGVLLDTFDFNTKTSLGMFADGGPSRGVVITATTFEVASLDTIAKCMFT
jgi:hypothetical protein